MKCKTKLLNTVVVLALVGVLVSLYTFLYKIGVVTADFCTVNSTFDCASVNASEYSEVFGIPVALLGVFGFGFMAIAAWLKSRNPEDKGLAWFLRAVVLGGLLFSLYLSGVEAFVLHAWCILCITSQIIILAIAVLTFMALFDECPLACPIRKCLSKCGAKGKCEIKKE